MVGKLHKEEARVESVEDWARKVQQQARAKVEWSKALAARASDEMRWAKAAQQQAAKAAEDLQQSLAAVRTAVTGSIDKHSESNVTEMIQEIKNSHMLQDTSNSHMLQDTSMLQEFG